MGRIEVAHQAEEFGADTGETVRGLLFIWQIAHEIFLSVDSARDMGHVVRALLVGEGGEAGPKDADYKSIWARGIHCVSLIVGAGIYTTLYDMHRELYDAGDFIDLV